MIYGAALLAVVCFGLAFERLGVVAVAERALQSGLNASRILRDASLNDDDKERAVRGASLVLLRHFGAIVSRSVVALAASLVPLLVLDQTGIASLAAVNSLLFSWTGLLFASVVVGLFYLARTRR